MSHAKSEIHLFICDMYYGKLKIKLDSLRVMKLRELQYRWWFKRFICFSIFQRSL